MSEEGTPRLPVVPLTVLVLLVLASLSPIVSVVTAHEEAPTELFEGAETLFVPYEKSVGIQQDGLVAEGEYSPYGHWLDTEEGVHLFMVHDRTSLYVALVNGLGGWAAVGFGESEAATFDANVVWWNGTAGVAEDRFVPAVSDELETFRDVVQAGTEDVYGFAASFEGSIPVFEFRVPLISGDARDVSLEPGRLHVGFVAFGADTPAPDSLGGGDAHFFRLYILRSSDDPAQIHDLFEGAAPPGPAFTLTTVALVALGVVALAWQFFGTRRRGRK